MGHSIQIFKNTKIIANDFVFEVVGSAILNASSLENQNWFSNLSAFWKEQLTLSINGCIDLGLEDHIKSDDQLNELLAATREAKFNLLSTKPKLTWQHLNTVLLSQYNFPNPEEDCTEIVRKHFEQFERFLENCLSPDTYFRHPE